VSKGAADIAAIEALLEPICRAQGVVLVDVCHRPERGGAVLRVLIEPEGAADHPDSLVSVTLEDCSRVSRALGAALDEHERLVVGHYRLEVSSPGIERPLVKAADYQRFAGREIKIQRRKPIDGRKHYTATLVGVNHDTVQLSVDGQSIDIPLNEISKANLVYRF